MTGTGAPARSTVGARAGTWCAEPELWMDVAVSVSVELIIHSIDRYLSPRPRPEVRSPPLLPRPRQNNVPSSLQAMDGSREYELSVRQQPKQARMCGVGGIFPSLLSLRPLIHLHRQQPIVVQSTHPPSSSCALLTKEKTFHRLPRRRHRSSTTNNHRTPTHIPTSLLVLWTPPCSLQQALARDPSSRIRITLCLQVSPSQTRTRSCIG